MAVGSMGNLGPHHKGGTMIRTEAGDPVRASQSEGIIVEQRGAEGAWYRRALGLSELLAPYAVVDNQVPS